MEGLQGEEKNVPDCANWEAFLRCSGDIVTSRGREAPPGEAPPGEGPPREAPTPEINVPTAEAPPGEGSPGEGSPGEAPPEDVPAKDESSAWTNFTPPLACSTCRGSLEDMCTGFNQINVKESVTWAFLQDHYEKKARALDEYYKSLQPVYYSRETRPWILGPGEWTLDEELLGRGSGSGSFGEEDKNEPI